MRRIKDFYSKRNKVCLVESDSKKFIYKIHSKEKSYYLEKEFYVDNKKNENIKIPNLISFNDNERILVLQYIEGKTMLEKLEVYEKKEDEKALLESVKLIINLYNWIDIFYSNEELKENRVALNDINFRNFIIKDNNIYGIDFEDLSGGDYKDRTGEILAFYLTYNPSFSLFKNKVIKEIINYLIEVKEYDKIELEGDINKELDIIKKRRGNL